MELNDVKSKEFYLKKMKDLKNMKDIEVSHIFADKILCEILNELGYEEIVNAYNDLNRYYS